MALFMHIQFVSEVALDTLKFNFWQEKLFSAEKCYCSLNCLVIVQVLLSLSARSVKLTSFFLDNGNYFL